MPAPDSFYAIVIVKESAFGTVMTSKVFSKSLAEKPVPDPGKVTEDITIISPVSNPCAALLIVAVAEAFVVVIVQLVSAVAKGVMS